LPRLSLYLSLASITADSDRNEGCSSLLNFATADRTRALGGFCHLGKERDRGFLELGHASLTAEIDLHWNRNTPINRPTLDRAARIYWLSKSGAQSQDQSKRDKGSNFHGRS
ncbi:MAG TPA: hypothetical protein DIV39_09345, partial [Verrucomicrobiales bacterium]|nr:hypothetical protein [Verrucomicrobiales bacterium]